MWGDIVQSAGPDEQIFVSMYVTLLEMENGAPAFEKPQQSLKMLHTDSPREPPTPLRSIYTREYVYLHKNLNIKCFPLTDE